MTDLGDEVPTAPAEPVRLSGGALAALAALARDGGAAAVAPAVRAELDELGATDAAGRVAPSWFPLADALAAPVGRVRLLQRSGTRTRRTDGWIAPGAAVLAVGGGDGAMRSSPPRPVASCLPCSRAWWRWAPAPARPAANPSGCPGSSWPR